MVVLPVNLHVLHIGGALDPLFQGRAGFPAGLLDLHLGGDFDQPLDVGVLPVGLQTLHLGAAFNQPLQVGAIPPGVVHAATGHVL